MGFFDNILEGGQRTAQQPQYDVQPVQVSQPQPQQQSQQPTVIVVQSGGGSSNASFWLILIIIIVIGVILYWMWDAITFWSTAVIPAIQSKDNLIGKLKRCLHWE